MSRSPRRLSLAVCAAAACALLSGCRSNLYQRAPVRGTVTCQGKPATGGVIIFQPLDAPEKTGRRPGHTGSASSGTVGEDGTFTLTAVDGKSGAGALIGPHRVLFQPPPTKRPTLSADDRAAMTPAEVQAAEEELRRRPVYPPLPCTANPSPAEVEVKPGTNEFTFTLAPK